MIKRVLSLVLVAAFCCTFGMVAFASEPEKVLVSEQTIQLSEDTYVVISLTETRTNSLTRGVETISGQRDYKYYQYNTLQWTFSVVGEYSVNMGVSATCTRSGYGFSASVGGWSLASGNSSKSGATATANGTVTGPNTLYPSVSMTCDKNGNLS